MNRSIFIVVYNSFAVSYFDITSLVIKYFLLWNWAVVLGVVSLFLAFFCIKSTAGNVTSSCLGLPTIKYPFFTCLLPGQFR